MSNSKFGGLGRRMGLLIGVMAAVMGVGASTALASVSVEPESPLTSETPVEVTAIPEELEKEATHAAIAVCNVEGTTTEAQWAERCNGEGGASPPYFIPPSPLAGGKLVKEITVKRTFVNTNFAGGPPPAEASTTCKPTGLGAKQCAVVASYYSWPEEAGNPEFLGADKVDVLIE